MIHFLQKRLAHFAGSWCCRSPANMKKYGLEPEIFYSIRPYNTSTADDLKACSGRSLYKSTHTHSSTAELVHVPRRACAHGCGCAVQF